ncbi:T9SS type B sorting domain-containing protein [Gelidibacter maritimus]|uniref:T9SS type B sorting domain-containing protein n=1 Tax=Gelidibacter maritimus TaxID=2761487 RepID=A0A7W2M5D0_9FLAO|nr:choice-of-anchor L domain-containing protein [Gelidibacter maritimus]MBA6153023.1 T9SS type B sorting domain-containing protein [Gelidibacter maritimus]
MLKKPFLTLILFLSFCNLIFAQQIATSNTLPLEALIQNTLGQGCVEISNISSRVNGSSDNLSSFGRFSKENSNFPFQNGLVLTTGDVLSAGNVLNTSPLNDGTRSWGTDPDLEAALGIDGTMNATSIEFDFISASNQIAFNYILASEEYLGTNPCLYSDGFAFLIKEAGSTSPYTNIALIPGTSTPVNTTTIRPEIVGYCPAENGTYFYDYNDGDTNYNGRTTVLTATANIKPNVAYRIKLIVADQKDPFYDSAVFIEGNSFNATVDLGPDISTCATSMLLNGSIDNSLATYRWFRNGTLIPGATNAMLTVNQSGNYKVRASVKLNNKTCELEDDITITLNAQQTLANIPDYSLCDDSSNNGLEVFDLHSRNNEVLKLLPPSNYNISYHYSQEEAEAGTNTILSPIQNTANPQDIFIRIQDVDNGCLTFSGVRLVVHPSPTITDPGPWTICDTDGTPDGVTEIDLRQMDSDLTNNDPNLFVSYHLNAIDANSGANPVQSPFTNSNPSHVFHVRVYDGNTDCFSTTTLDVTVVNPPRAAIDKPYLNACVDSGTGFETFDLTSIIDELLVNLSDIPENFYESEDDAEAGINPIANAANYQNIVSEFQIVYIKIVDGNTGCFNIVPIELHTDITITGLVRGDFNGCDDASEDGIVDFDLLAVESQLLNEYEGFKVTFYESQADQENGLNAIDKNLPFTVNSNTPPNPHIIYITVSVDNCDTFISINLIVNPPLIIPPLVPVTYCDTDQDGVANILLETFDAHVTHGINGANVRYFETEEDALNNEPSLDTHFYNTTNPQTIYARVTNTLTSCYDVTPLTIQIELPPAIIGHADIIQCDDDLDGYYVVDLTSKIPELVADTTGLTISFHNNYNLALSGEDPISNPENYNSPTQYIAVRVEDNVTGCVSIADLYVYINTRPIFIPISNFENCEAAGNPIADFYFYEKDEEILNGQSDKHVLYFETSEDAENRTNIIDKFAPYPNTSSPQTVYVRVEATTDADCYGTTSFDLEVGSLPAFNAPEDEFICDGLNNDEVVTFDLNTKISEISKNINEPIDITLYTSEADAKDLINPIKNLSNYTNSVNPQPIFARIENGTYCYALTKFSINVVQLPAVTTPTDIIDCDTDDDGTIVFDLTVVEIEVLDLRQDNIIVTYHESLEGAETDSEIISSPNKYKNTSINQTVYIKINNTVSNCFVNLPIKLKVNLPPAINDFKNYRICSNPEKYFDLNTINKTITSESNISVSYYSTQSDAIADENAISTDYTYTTTNDRIYARLENTKTGCISYYDFRLVVLPLPVANTPDDLEDCDDDFDGYLAFDLSEQTPTILNGQNPTNYEVSYHNSQSTANSGSNPLKDIYAAKDGQLIYARVTNLITGCFSTTQFSAIVHPRPVISITDQVLCIDNAPLVVNAETNNPSDTYLWSTGATTPEIDITTIGSYSLTITSSFGCQSTQEFQVIASEAASIDATETVDFSDPNNITITISGIGNYRYVLDDGPPQESNVFNNVTLGYHTITIIDLNGCAKTTKEVVVIDAPKFVTPNNDGYFDTWHISGIETLPGSVINIFDRYGKHITTLTSSSQGWDGTYNGHLMPSSDYWFVGKIKKNDNTFEVKGHFALKL